MDIFEVLKTKPHNIHYLNRYHKFILACSNLSDINDQTENHHICPRAADMFPQFSSFKEHSWNKIKLTHRQHYIAHLLLFKCYGKSQAVAFNLMVNRGFGKIKTSKLFDEMKTQMKKYNSDFTINQQNNLTKEEKKIISTKRHETIKVRFGGNWQPRLGQRNSKESNEKNRESSRKVIKTEEWNKKNSLANIGKICIGNLQTGKLHRIHRLEAEKLVASQPDIWVRCNKNKKLQEIIAMQSVLDIHP